jgi:hypothetical protein
VAVRTSAAPAKIKCGSSFRVGHSAFQQMLINLAGARPLGTADLARNKGSLKNADWRYSLDFVVVAT